MSRANDEIAGAAPALPVAADVATPASTRPPRPVAVAVIVCAGTILANLDLFVVNAGFGHAWGTLAAFAFGGAAVALLLHQRSRESHS